MSDFRNILSKFNELGIENKGLTPDAPTQQSASKETPSSSTEADHARLVNESVKGKHIPGVTDVRASEFAALAGLGSNTRNVATQSVATQPQTVSQPVTTNRLDKWSEVENRLDSIENKINSIFEALVSKEKNVEKQERYTKDLDDLERQIRKSGSMDKDTEDAIKARRLKIIKDKEVKLAAGMRETTEQTLQKDFASFLKDLEG